MINDHSEGHATSCLDQQLLDLVAKVLYLSR